VVYGRPAIAAALDLRCTVNLTPQPGPAIHLDLPGLAHAEETTWDAVRAYARAASDRWDAYAANPAAESFATVRGEDPAHLVKVALGEAAEELESLPFSSPFPGSGGGLRLRVVSQLPVGSGFGSSAATATAVVAALVVRHGGSLADAAGRAAIERIAFAAERRQHGLPSGIDGAAVLHGGVLWARKLPAVGGGGGLETAPIAASSPVLERIGVYDTGMPAEPTGAVVAAVRARRERDPAAHERILDRIAAATAAFRAELEAARADPARIVHLIGEAEECLEALGVVPAGVRSLVRRIEAAGGAAKISGAGSLLGPGAGSLLVYHPELESLSGWSLLQPFPSYAVRLGAPGLRGETDA
jgi:mevalonate kinase